MDVETKDITHDEIWDDSALVDSWNEALEEYKKYHSVATNKGAKLADVPGEQKTRGDAKAETDKPAERALRPDRETSLPTDAGKPRMGGGGVEVADSVGSGVHGPEGFTPPIAVLGSVRDEGLKSLLMAWYYAGYYTGLHEGQNQHQHQHHQ